MANVKLLFQLSKSSQKKIQNTFKNVPILKKKPINTHIQTTHPEPPSLTSIPYLCILSCFERDDKGQILRGLFQIIMNNTYPHLVN